MPSLQHSRKPRPIHRAFRQAVLWGWVSANPAANATPPRLRKSELSPPEIDEVEELLRSAFQRDPEFANFLHIAAPTGARRGEICALRWSNLDAKLGTLTIERNVIEVPGGIIEKDTKTHQNRRIALDDDTIAVFENQLALSEERAGISGGTLSDDSLVFSVEPDGSRPWIPGAVTKRFVLLRNDLGYNSMRLHDLRHFAATRLAAAGVPVRTVSGRLGHANPATTLSVYSHFVEASDQEAAAVMGRLVSLSNSRSKANRRGQSTSEKAGKTVRRPDSK